MSIPGVPSWANPTAPPLPPPPSGVVDPPLFQRLTNGDYVVYPMVLPDSWGIGYQVPGGWDDATQVNQALLQAGPGRNVYLWPAVFQTLSSILVPGGTATVAGVNLLAPRGAVIMPAFGGAASNTGAAVSAHGSAPGAASVQGNGTQLRGFTVDGANVPAAVISTGVDYGDQYDGSIDDVTVQNFVSSGTTTSTGSNPLGAVGLNVNNQVTLTEKLHIRRVVISNCGTPNTGANPNQGGGAHLQSVTTTGSTTSRMYGDWDFHVNTQPHQNGLVIARQGHIENFVLLRMRGNFNRDANPALCAAVVLGVANPGGGAPQQGHINNAETDITVESDPSAGTGTFQPFTVAFGTNADNTVGLTRGRWQFQYGNWQQALNYTPSSAPTAQFQFSGRLKGDTSLFAPGPPASPLITTTPYVNNGVDAVVYVSGGTVSAILINGTTTGLTSGAFLWPMGATLQINASPMPTVNFLSNLRA